MRIKCCLIRWGIPEAVSYYSVLRNFVMDLADDGQEIRTPASIK